MAVSIRRNVGMLWAGCAVVLAAVAAQVQADVDAPTVMVLIEEQSLGAVATDEVDALLTELLGESGLQVVDRNMVRSRIAKDKSLMELAGNVRGSVALGLQFGADIVVNGTAVAKPAARRIAGSNLRSYEAAVTLRAVRTDNARMLATASETATVVGLEDVSGSAKALKKAGATVGNLLIDRMLRSFEEGGEGGSAGDITLVFGGVDRLWKLKAVRDSVQACALIQDLAQQAYTAGTVTFSASSGESIALLAEALVMNAPKDLAFQILESSPGKITANVVDR